jgi:hypothetical protein
MADTRTCTEFWQHTSAVSLIANRQLDAPRIVGDSGLLELQHYPSSGRPSSSEDIANSLLFPSQSQSIVTLGYSHGQFGSQEGNGLTT